MAAAVPGLHPMALIGTPYQLPNWCTAAHDPSRAFLQALAASCAGRPSPRLGRGTHGWGGCPDRDAAPRGWEMAWPLTPLGQGLSLSPAVKQCWQVAAWQPRRGQSCAERGGEAASTAGLESQPCGTSQPQSPRRGSLRGAELPSQHRGRCK